MKNWGFIGAGKMATALVRGMLRSRVARDDAIVASDPLEAVRTLLQAESGIAVFESNLDVMKQSDVVVLAVKPQSMSHVLEELRRAITPEHLVISIAAGITIDSIVAGLGRRPCGAGDAQHARALIGEGISAFAREQARVRRMRRCRRLAGLGRTVGQGERVDARRGHGSLGQRACIRLLDDRGALRRRRACGPSP